MIYRFLGAAVLALGLSSLPAFGQFLSLGVKGGIPLNDVYTNGGNGDLTGNTNRFIVGPMGEVRLPFQLGVEADALYRHYSMNGNGVSEWEFPILLKYRFGHVPLFRPYVDAGPIFNHVTNIPGMTPNQSATGVAVGAGLDLHPIFVHISPEFRYIHWGSPNYNFAALNSNLQSNQNQLQFLVGLTF
jgi:hypothetical protein